MYAKIKVADVVVAKRKPLEISAKYLKLRGIFLNIFLLRIWMAFWSNLSFNLRQSTKMSHEKIDDVSPKLLKTINAENYAN